MAHPCPSGNRQVNPLCGKRYITGEPSSVTPHSSHTPLYHASRPKLSWTLTHATCSTACSPPRPSPCATHTRPLRTWPAATRPPPARSATTRFSRAHKHCSKFASLHLPHFVAPVDFCHAGLDTQMTAAAPARSHPHHDHYTTRHHRHHHHEHTNHALNIAGIAAAELCNDLAVSARSRRRMWRQCRRTVRSSRPKSSSARTT